MIHFARKQRQLKNLARQTQDLLIKSNGVITKKISRLKCKLQHLINELSDFVSQIKLIRIVGSLYLTLGLSVNQLSAQQFANAVENPFGACVFNIDIYEGVFDLDFADIDNDGDLDLFSIAYDNDAHQIYYQQNVGNSVNAEFSQPFENQFNLSLILGTCENNEVLTWDLNLVDIDGDGDFDLFVSGYYAEIEDCPNGLYVYEINPIIYFENIGTVNNPTFTPLSPNSFNPFNISIPPMYLRGVEFVDLDNDGDYDLLVSGYNDETIDSGLFAYQENTGSSVNPNFDNFQINPFNLQTTTFNEDEGYNFDLEFIDIDQDGDLDFFAGSYYGISFYENTGSINSPSFSLPATSPFNLCNDVVKGYIFFDFADIDNDGDLDFFSNNYYTRSGSKFQENISLTELSSVVFNSNKKLKKVVDPLGREVRHTTNQILFHIYDDGSVEKKFINE